MVFMVVDNTKQQQQFSVELEASLVPAEADIGAVAKAYDHQRNTSSSIIDVNNHED